jgi:hypothetical protein
VPADGARGEGLLEIDLARAGTANADAETSGAPVIGKLVFTVADA